MSWLSRAIATGSVIAALAGGCTRYATRQYSYSPGTSSALGLAEQNLSAILNDVCDKGSVVVDQFHFACTQMRCEQWRTSYGGTSGPSTDCAYYSKTEINIPFRNIATITAEETEVFVATPYSAFPQKIRVDDVIQARDLADAIHYIARQQK